MGTPSILIFTNKLVLRLSDFAAKLSFVVSSALVTGFDKLLLPARFFLNEPIGGHPTTGAGAVLLVF